MKRFHYIDENNAEQYDRESHLEWLKKYGFKCDTCNEWFELDDIHSITGENESCDVNTLLTTTCVKCNKNK